MNALICLCVVPIHEIMNTPQVECGLERCGAGPGHSSEGVTSFYVIDNAQDLGLFNIMVIMSTPTYLPPSPLSPLSCVEGCRGAAPFIKGYEVRSPSRRGGTP